MNDRRWYNLVTETQFATELVLSGISRVCTLPMDTNAISRVSYDQIYPLHVGLHMYTSGLERLCKLALACHGFVLTGSFSTVRSYSHRLSELLDSLERLDLGQFNSYHPEYLCRPDDEYGDGLVEWLERYASGPGRYELLDSLSRDDAEVLTWDVWSQFCARGTVSDDVKLSIDIHRAVGDALADICVANDLESAVNPYLETIQSPLSESSAAVGLAMYRRARWAAETLGVVTHYTHEGLPILREVLNVLTQTSANFFTYEVAKISDTEPVIEELKRHAETFVMDDSNYSGEPFEEE